MKTVGFLIGIILAGLVLVWLFGGAGMMGVAGLGMMRGYGTPYGFVSSPWARLVSLGSWVMMIGGVVLLGFWLVQGEQRSAESSLSHESALETVKARYARGEITKEQFDALKQNLGA